MMHAKLGAKAVMAVAILLSALPPVHLSAQSFDRTKQPPAGPTPAIRVPEVARRTLANGLELMVVTERELPIVSAVLQINAGAVHDGARGGLAQMTAALLDEGTAVRNALDFAAARERIGAELGAFAGDEMTQVSLLTLKRHADSAFALLGEMVTRPAFAAEELERERKSRLQALRQQKDRPTVIASQVFARTVYGAEHPYGRPAEGTVATVEALSRDDVTGFYGRYYRPNNALLVVVGDVTLDEAARWAERALGGWQKAALPADAKRAPASPKPAATTTAAAGTTVYLVDRPGAAQSEIRIGHVGAARSASPDYYALQVLNTALGGAFTSRINLNLRETRGFTYGARSTFVFQRGAGPFVASAGVFTAKTDSSLVEFLKELKDVREGRPLSQQELEFAKASLVRSYPRRFETAGGIAQMLADLAFYGLPLSELAEYPKKIEKVTTADVTRVAKRYIDPSRLSIVVVGDLAQIRPGIEALNLGRVVVLDEEGDAVGTQD